MKHRKSRRRAAQAVGALLALALLVVLGLYWRGEGAVLDSAMAPEPTEFAEPVKTSVSAPEAASDAKESSRVEPELASPPSATPSDGRIRVRVLHHESLEPLAGAEVRWIEGSELRDPELSPLVFHPTSESRWIEGCQLVTCDASGEAMLPMPESSLRVEATHGALWGHTWVTRPTKDAYDVFVAPSETLRVLVVDSEGRPAPGVGVAVAPAGERYPGSSPLQQTGTDGIARISNARGWVLAGGHGPLLIRACVVGDVPVQTIVDLRVDRDQTVKLELPPTCAVTVRLVETSGEVWPGRAPVAMMSGVGLIFEESKFGMAEFPYVVVGTRCTALLQTFCDGAYRYGRCSVRAENVSGGPPTFDLVFERLGLRLKGRALGPDGAPLPDTRLEAHRSGARPLLGLATTDADGRFEFQIQAGAPAPLDFIAILAPRHGGERRIEGPISLDGGQVELGDIMLEMLEKLPTGLVGRVVDPVGRPLEGATVAGEVREKGFDASKFKPEPGHAVMEWFREPRGTARTDGNGRFELPKAPGDKDCRIRVGLKGFRSSKPLEITREMRDIEIVLQPNPPVIQGRVVLESHDAMQHLKLRCKSDEVRWSNVRSGAFEILRERAGPVDLEIFTDGESLVGETPLVRIEGIEDTNDPRLAAIDLRPLVQEFRFEIERADDVAPNNLHVSAALPGTMIWSFTAGPAVLILLPKALVEAEPLLDVRVSPELQLSCTFERVSNGARLKLRRFPRVLLKVPDSLPAATAETPYVVLAHRPDADPCFGQVHEGRSGAISIEKPGEWTLSWRIGNNGTKLMNTTIVVGEQDVECVLNCGPEAVEAELERQRAKVK